MSDVHVLAVTAEPSGLVFACDECGRRMVIDRDGRYTVIDHGDPAAVHRGGIGGVGLDPPVVRTA